MNPDFGPSGSNAFVTAVDWLDATLLGSLASAVAIIAIAWVGLLLISGRVDVRRAMQVILGCFIVFGASPIAAGIIAALHGSGAPNEIVAPPPPPSYSLAPAQAVNKSVPYDPYAGAALPPR